MSNFGYGVVWAFLRESFMETVTFALYHKGRVKFCQANKENNFPWRENTASKDSKKMKELSVFCVSWKVQKLCNMRRGYEGKLLKELFKDDGPIKSLLESSVNDFVSGISPNHSLIVSHR